MFYRRTLSSLRRLILAGWTLTGALPAEGSFLGLWEMTRRLRADFSFALCSLLWGTTFVVVKNVLDHASVFIFLAVRFTAAAALMLAWSNYALQRLEEVFGC